MNANDTTATRRALRACATLPRPAERGRLAATCPLARWRRRVRALVVALCAACLWGPSAARASTHTADAGGGVWAWGDNSSGELGTGHTANSAVPVAVRGLSGVTAIVSSLEFDLAIAR